MSTTANYGFWALYNWMKNKIDTGENIICTTSGGSGICLYGVASFNGKYCMFTAPALSGFLANDTTLSCTHGNLAITKDSSGRVSIGGLKVPTTSEYGCYGDMFAKHKWKQGQIETLPYGDHCTNLGGCGSGYTECQLDDEAFCAVTP